MQPVIFSIRRYIQYMSLLLFTNDSMEDDVRKDIVWLCVMFHIQSVVISMARYSLFDEYTRLQTV